MTADDLAALPATDDATLLVRTCFDDPAARVENNLRLANMDWTEFSGSTDPDGTHRGF